MDLNTEREVGKNSTIDLKFRESIIFSLGVFPKQFTKEQFFTIFSKIHLRLKEAGFLSFQLPQKSVFINMIRKLTRLGLIEETYNNRNYVLSLSISGMATYEVILDNLQEHPSFGRISNIYNLYKKATVF